MRSILKWIEKSIIILGILFYGWVLVLNLCMENVMPYYRRNKCLVSNISLVGIGILLIGVFAYLSKRYPDKIHIGLCKTDKWSKILSVVLFFTELIISYEIAFSSGWDAGEVSWQASLVAVGESELDNNYFSHYPNNLLITFLYSIIYRFAGLFGLQMYGSVIIVLLQCAISALTGYLLYRVSQKMFCSYKIAYLTWMIYALWVGLMPWYTVTYSDPVGIIFPVLIVWLYQSMENNKAIWGKSMLIGILAFLGFQIKPTILILYIAILIMVILRLIKKQERDIRLRQLGGLIIAFVVVFGIYQKVDLAKCMGFELDKEQELTVTHFAMMGLSEKTNGVYDQDDVEYSTSFDNKKERQEANIKIIKQRLEEYGFIGVVKHLAKKTLNNYNDGTFAWGKEGGFFLTEIEKREEIFSKALKSLYYNKGTNRTFLNTYMQFFYIMMLIGVFMNLLYAWRKKNLSDLFMVMILSLVGMFLFVSMFEARARYLYVYAPLYILIGVQGYVSVLYPWFCKLAEKFNA